MSDMYTKQQNLDISEKRVHETDISIHELERLKDLNRRLVATAKELGYADDIHEWDEAWSKMCKLMKEVV
jgi:coenzyme F420-reducing hydrogenase delta subunit